MRDRYLAEECNICPDNNKSLAWCFDCCAIPYDLLEDIENKQKEIERRLALDKNNSDN